MKTNGTDCLDFKVDENVISGLQSENEITRGRVMYCLFHLYNNDCIPWLIRIAGRKQGETDAHNAHQAFENALLATEYAIKNNRFAINDKPNAVRRFLYFVSQRYYWKLQGTKKSVKMLEISDVHDNRAYPKPEFYYQLEIDERIKKIHEAILDMPDPCREILWMKFAEGLKVSDIAAMLNTDTNKISSQLYKCRNKLKETFPLNFRENF